MRIELANLENGKAEFSATYGADQLELEDERVRLAAPVSIEGRIKRSGAEVIVSGHINGELFINCDRCLKPLEMPLNNDFELDYVTGSDYEALHDVELTEEQMAISVFDGVGIDIDEIVKEQVLLAVPARLLCREDCKGICPVCGSDRNTTDCNCETSSSDPRWDALRSLKQ